MNPRARFPKRASPSRIMASGISRDSRGVFLDESVQETDGLGAEIFLRCEIALDRVERFGLQRWRRSSRDFAVRDGPGAGSRRVRCVASATRGFTAGRLAMDRSAAGFTSIHSASMAGSRSRLRVLLASAERSPRSANRDAPRRRAARELCRRTHATSGAPRRPRTRRASRPLRTASTLRCPAGNARHRANRARPSGG